MTDTAILHRAVQTWHELLLADAGLAAESAERLEDHQRRWKLQFSGRALCSVLRPRMLTHAQYTSIRRRVRVLMRTLCKVHARGMAEDGFRGQLRLREWEEEVLGFAPGFRSPSPISRLDAFFSTEDGSLKVTEYNAENPAGPAFADALTDVFFALPVTGEFLRSFVLHPLPCRHGVLHALLQSFAEWCGRRELPRIGILDWSDVPTRHEFQFLREYFRSHGIEAVIADPRACEYHDGALFAPGGFRISLIYKRVLLDELIGRMGLDNPIFRAVKDRAVCMVDPLCCKLMHKKASLAVLSDERNAGMFDAEEQAVIDACVPWTRLVEERRTVRDGATVDLLPWIAEHRERLVLKPNDDYGGHGIVLGWLVSDEAWQKAVQTALSSPYVVQERIALPREPFPSWAQGSLEVADRMLDLAPYVTMAAQVDGALTRISTDPLLNVCAGGGSSIPTMLVEER